MAFSFNILNYYQHSAEQPSKTECVRLLVTKLFLCRVGISEHDTRTIIKMDVYRFEGNPWSEH